MFIWEKFNKKKKKNKKKLTYLPTLKILGRVTANKHFFKDGLMTKLKARQDLTFDHQVQP
jgi:hypothetical protein